MSIVTLELPLGRRPKRVYQDIRTKMVEWLTDHVGPMTEPFLSYNRLNEEDEFLLLHNAYMETVGDSWEYCDNVLVIGAMSGEQWRIFHLSVAERPPDSLGGLLFKHQFAVHLDDELLAVQFKLSCL
jgi:hypothetical protein